MVVAVRPSGGSATTAVFIENPHAHISVSEIRVAPCSAASSTSGRTAAIVSVGDSQAMSCWMAASWSVMTGLP